MAGWWRRRHVWGASLWASRAESPPETRGGECLSWYQHCTHSLLHPVHSSDIINPTLGLKFYHLLLLSSERTSNLAVPQRQAAPPPPRPGKSSVPATHCPGSLFVSNASHSDFINQSHHSHLEIPTAFWGVTLLWSQHEETWVCNHSLFVSSLSSSFYLPECMRYWIFVERRGNKVAEKSLQKWVLIIGIKSSLTGACVVRLGPISFR